MPPEIRDDLQAELKRLRKENAVLRQERDILKKSRGLARPALGASSLRSSTSRAGTETSFNVIESLSAVIGFHLRRPTEIPKVAGVSVMFAERAGAVVTGARSGCQQLECSRVGQGEVHEACATSAPHGILREVEAGFARDPMPPTRECLLCGCAAGTPGGRLPIDGCAEFHGTRTYSKHDCVFRSTRSPIGARRRGGSVVPPSDRHGSAKPCSFASILLSA